MPSLKRRKLLPIAAIAGAGVITILWGNKPAHAVITVNYTEGSGLATDPDRLIIRGAFEQAANRWVNAFGNTFNFNFTIDFATLDPGVLGATDSTEDNYSFANYRNALVSGATSADDALAAASLPTSNSLNLLINYTTNNPNGSGSATPYLDNNGGANNTQVYMTNANAKALGLLSATNAATDATITFSSRFRNMFDFDPSNGIASNQYDFVGIATHEIGHALGFISGVDILDGNSPNPRNGSFFSDNAFTFVTPLDTFRYSSQSANSVGGAVIDFTADNRVKYFSLDKGATSIAQFSTGVTHGDGNQASHWKDNLGIGIMDPTAAFGERLQISNTDLRAFDVIGYRLNGADTPEPSSLGLVGFAGLGLVGARRLRSRRRHSAK